jgi:hypothetical protein
MADYYVNKNPQTTGEHEIHSSECIYLPKVENRQHLGDFNKCQPAIKKAREYYTDVNGCFYCSYECKMLKNY